MIIIIKFIHIFEYAVHIIFTAMKKYSLRFYQEQKS